MAFNNQETQFKLTYVRAVNIPQEKSGHWYTVLSTDDIPGLGPFTLDLFKEDQSLNLFIPQPSAMISVKLFAQHKMQTWRSDTLIAQGTMQIDSLVVGEAEDYSKKNSSNPTLVFNIIVITRADLTRVNIDPAPLEVNPTLAKAMDGIRCLVSVGVAFSHLNPIAKTVMSLVDLGVTELDNLLKRNESVLLLVEELNYINLLIMDWDDPSHVEHQPHREHVCQELLPEIGQCLNLLQQLSQAHHEKWLSAESVKEVDNHRKKLHELFKRLKSNQHLDTQNAVFEVKETVKNIPGLYKDTLLSKLYVAKDGGSVGSKVCLEGTRVALLQHIYDWALDSLGARTLLLNGGAGKGKSAIAHTIAKKLQSSGQAIVPFFAFNRSVRERSSSQLIPTWIKHLAERNIKYLAHLQSLMDDELCSTDIVDQLNILLLKPLTDIVNDCPIIFIVDALDECDEGEV
ncbi:hypothetical protein H0H92_014963, partial [Tricholoma furcatifolium]